VRALSLLLLVACSRKTVAVADDAAPGKTTAKIPEGFEYAEAKTGEKVSTEGFVVWLARDGLRLRADAAPLIPLSDPLKGFAAEHKQSGEHDLRLPALEAKVEGSRAIMHVDRRIGYRVLIEVLFTLGQSKVSRWAFVTADGRALELTAPKLPDLTGGAKTPLSFTVLVVSGGFIVKARGGNLAADCTTVAPGITISSHDFSALRKCAETARGDAPDRNSMMTANPDTPFQTVVSTWDALRRRDDGTPLLPDISLSVLR
jgi:hypothetical protein